ncbi:uncharacterized protein LOC111088280 [Limulus polyphemus]|uniref:Uncharacterized protein LOC111088280 n=1 Tax=Limulus polyphemus TaxID=6850 RepID=A0ABM1TCN7_LIMPO|nr:uncharacterized protein LOC111088280 [Limulus polyphemus]
MMFPTNEMEHALLHSRQIDSSQNIGYSSQMDNSEEQGSVDPVDNSPSTDDTSLSLTDSGILGKIQMPSTISLVAQVSNGFKEKDTPSTLCKSQRHHEDEDSSESETLNSSGFTEAYAKLNDQVPSVPRQRTVPETPSDCKTMQIHSEQDQEIRNVSTQKTPAETYKTPLVTNIPPMLNTERRSTPVDTLLRRARIQRLDTDSL